jgi:hypothetical protein
MTFDLLVSVFVGVVVVSLAVLLRWVSRSFRRWPATDDERRADIWARRGGGDM